MARKIIWIVGYIAALPIVIILSIVWGLSVFTRTFRTAAALGLTFSEKDAVAAAEFHDSLKVLHAGLLGFEFSVGKKVIPTLTDLSVSLAALTEQGEWFGKSWLKDFAIGATVSLSALPIVFADLVNWSDEASKSLGDWAASAAWANRNSDDLTKRILQLRDVLKPAHAGGGAGAAFDIPKTVKIPHLEEVKDEVAALIVELDKADQQFGLSANAVKLYDLALHGASASEVALAGRTIASTAAKQRAHDETEALAAAADSYQESIVSLAAQIEAESLTSRQAFEMQIEKL